MRSGPQYYPGASRAYWYEDSYGGDAMEINVCVLHTTEGTALPSYGGGTSAPNITAVPDFDQKKLRWFQHFRIDTSSRALMNLRGGPETNTLNVTQVELVGTCDPATHRRWGDRRHIFWPAAPEWALRDLGRFLGWLHREHGVRLQAPSRWLPYPQSYGATSARMSAAEWRGFYGICGHQHVVENDHGDPGDINIDKILAYARGEEDDVTPEDIDKIADRVVDKLLSADRIRVPWESDNKFNQVNNAWESMWRQTHEAVGELGSLGKQVDLLRGEVAKLAVGGVDLNALAVAVVDEMHRRTAE